MSRAAPAALVSALVAALILGAGAAAAHDLRVFAWVDGDEVVVESRFADGAPPRTAVARVRDADGALILETPLGPDGIGRFALGAHRDGLRIEVRTDGNHEDYWLLTPQDIAKGRR